MQRTNLSKRMAGRKSQFGQGMTEYIIIVALIAIGAIGVFTAFGRTVREQAAAVAFGLAGDQGQASTHNGNADTQGAAHAGTDAGHTQGLNNFTQDAAGN